MPKKRSNKKQRRTSGRRTEPGTASPSAPGTPVIELSDESIAVLRFIVKTIERFPLTVSAAGDIGLTNNSIGLNRDVFQGVYEDFELALMKSEVSCNEDHVHATVDSDQFWTMVISDMMHTARKGLGTAGELHAIWSAEPGYQRRLIRLVDWAKRPLDFDGCSSL